MIEGPEDETRHFLVRMLGPTAHRLEDEGWTLAVRKVSSQLFQISFSHPLSVQFEMSLRDEDSHKRYLDRFLHDPEFAAIAGRPPAAPNELLLGRIREASYANDWQPDVVSVLARILVASDVITHDEATWLEEAGVPWPGQREE